MNTYTVPPSRDYYIIQEGETLPNVLSFPSRRPPERLIDFNYQHIITMS